MASEKNTYPYLPTKAWWTLRQKFNRSIPPQVTPPYLVAVLGGKETSAKGNVLPALKAVGLVDEDGATTNRAKLWRDDTSYADVCREIREEIYPPDLLNAIPDASLGHRCSETLVYDDDWMRSSGSTQDGCDVLLACRGDSIERGSGYGSQVEE